MFKSIFSRATKFRHPDFFVIGAQKAGTTALYTYLSKHPYILATKEKEHHFFNCDKNYQKGIKYYSNLFPKAKKKISFDASPGYLENFKSPKRIYDYNPNAKILILLRNPVDRAYSAWQMYRTRYQENRNWFFDGWVPFCNGNKNEYIRRCDDNIFDFHSFILEELRSIEIGQKTYLEAPVIYHGYYVEQIERYLKYFGRDTIMIVESNELLLRTQDVLNEIHRFLDIPAFQYDEGNLSPVFRGGYIRKMEQKTKTLLERHYYFYNKKLVKLLDDIGFSNLFSFYWWL